MFFTLNCGDDDNNDDEMLLGTAYLLSQSTGETATVTISGTAKDNSDRSLISNGSISISETTSSNSSNIQSRATISSSATTDDSGSFTLNLKEAEYKITISKSDGTEVGSFELNIQNLTSKHIFPINTTGVVISLTSATATDGTDLLLQLLGGYVLNAELSLSTAVTTLAGSGSAGSTDGTGTSASFNAPAGITTDGTNLYVAETGNHIIRQIVISSGVVTTLAGSGSAGSTDGTGTSASFNEPNALTTDRTNLYVSESGNHNIRQIVISSGVVTTLADSGSAGSTDGTGTSASFNTLNGITTDGTNLYVADTGNHIIRQIVISSGVVTTLAGSGSAGSTDGTGTSASFNAPAGITTDGTNLYLVEYSNHNIRQIVISSGVVTTLAGSGSAGSTDGTGTSASFNQPPRITTDGIDLYVTDQGNYKIRKID